jgi:hypothetical protein
MERRTDQMVRFFIRVKQEEKLYFGRFEFAFTRNEAEKKVRESCVGVDESCAGVKLRFWPSVPFMPAIFVAGMNEERSLQLPTYAHCVIEACSIQELHNLSCFATRGN